MRIRRDIAGLGFALLAAAAAAMAAVAWSGDGAVPAVAEEPSTVSAHAKLPVSVDAVAPGAATVPATLVQPTSGTDYSFCSGPCIDASQCPPGCRCQFIGSTGVCVPGGGFPVREPDPESASSVAAHAGDRAVSTECDPGIAKAGS